MEMLPQTEYEPPVHFPPSEDRQLDVYLMHEFGIHHIQLTEGEFDTFHHACGSIKTYWDQYLTKTHAGTTMMLTNNLGALVYRDNWDDFVAAQIPCLAWCGKESINRLLDGITRRKEIHKKQLDDLCFTEQIARHVQSAAPGRVPSIEFNGTGGGGDDIYAAQTDTDQEGPLMMRACDQQGHVVSGEYAAMLEQEFQEVEEADVLEYFTSGGPSTSGVGYEERGFCGA